MKAVDFYYFTGSGNTLLVVRKMAEAFAARGVETRLLRLEKSDPARVDVSRTLGLAFPVAAFSTYPLVWRFIHSLPPGKGAEAFAVDTLAGFSGGVLGPLKIVLKRKGYRPIGAKEIIMPSNFMIKTLDTAKNEALKARGLLAAERYAVDLIENKGRWTRIPFLSDLVLLFSRTAFNRHSAARFVKLDTDRATCCHCGLCAHLCPAKNIVMKDSFPSFNGLCQGCLRCFSYCPSKAIFLNKARAYRRYQAIPPNEFFDFIERH